MNGIATRLIVFVIRGWTRVYTTGLPPLVGEARRREIESDVWELQQDDDDRGLGVPLQLLGRLFLGVPDDLLWRVERAPDDPAIRRAVASVLAVGLVSGALWFGQAWLSAGGKPGQGPVANCASGSAPPQTSGELRLRIMGCAGAFFKPAPHAGMATSKR